MEEFGNHLIEYFSSVDNALEILSHKDEGKISNLPSWALTTRKIGMGISDNQKGIIIKVTPDETITHDCIFVGRVSTTEDLYPFFDPGIPEFHPQQLANMPFMMIWDLFIYGDNNLLSAPAMENRSLVGYGSLEFAKNRFELESSKVWAIDLWNKARSSSTKPGSFVKEAKDIFQKFKAIIRRSSFVERKIHRYINEHAFLLLPSYSSLYYEHPLYLEDQKQVADFILKRESGIAPLLIELESSSHRVFKENGELTQKANHAREQIGKWVTFIDRDAKRNACGEFSFLAGNKDRLVVIGRGLRHRENMENTKYLDTTIWTYDYLLEQAKTRWNNDIAAQCKLVGLEEIRPF